VKELPKEPAKDTVYYVEGGRDSTKSREATNKEKLFLGGHSVVFNEHELNVLVVQHTSGAGAKTKPVPKAKPNEPPPPPPEDPLLSLGAPNFRVRENVLQVGAPLRLNALGFEGQFIVQARGGFTKEGDQFVYSPSEIYVGSFPLHRVPALQALVLKRFAAKLAAPAEYTAAWHKLANATVAGSAVKLTMQ